jgi:hypothetical protein
VHITDSNTKRDTAFVVKCVIEVIKLMDGSIIFSFLIDERSIDHFLEKIDARAIDQIVVIERHVWMPAPVAGLWVWGPSVAYGVKPPW